MPALGAALFDSQARASPPRGRRGIRGQLVLPEDAGFNEARSIWNAMIDRRPAMILRCAGVADVRRGIAFARANNLPLAVRGGGHNIAGSALCEDGLVMDFSRMKSVRIDPVARRAYVEPGATLADFDHEAQAFGLATPLGINSTTGVAGLTLGGGGNFGVVTSFEFALHPVGPMVYGGLVVFPLAQARDALVKYRAASTQMPDDLSVWAVLRLAPPLPFLPTDVHGQPVIIFANYYTGPTANGPSAVAQVKTFGTPVGEHLGEMPFVMWQQAFDPLLTPGSRNYWKSHNLAGIDDGLIDALLQSIENLPSPQCEIFFGQIGGQTQRVPVNATAYSNRDTHYAMNVHGRWENPADDDRCIGWARAFFDAAVPFSLGSVYVNFMTQEEGGRVADAYGPNYERLVAVKSRYDPHNLFRHNQNIRPAM
ncbi:MAG: Putative oxidoreductase [uncultured Paraburkholderia sp.]|nr:MAG: Putative oxidoreductase [uncultured Paraburkholderia sp.]